MTAPFGTINHIEMFQWEAKLPSESLDPSSQISFGQRSEFVEHRLDWLSVGSDSFVRDVLKVG